MLMLFEEESFFGNRLFFDRCTSITRGVSPNENGVRWPYTAHIARIFRPFVRTKNVGRSESPFVETHLNPCAPESAVAVAPLLTLFGGGDGVWCVFRRLALFPSGL